MWTMTSFEGLILESFPGKVKKHADLKGFSFPTHKVSAEKECA